MIRYLCSIVALVGLLAAPAQAGQITSDSGIGFSKANLVKSSFTAGKVGIDVYADGRVDVASLFTDVDLSKAASAQSIADRVNVNRKQLYPDEEILLAITPPQGKRAAAADEKAGLVKALYWWNNTNCSTCLWYAEYTATVATMFIDDIEYGAYNLYDRPGGNRYIFRYRVDEGDAATMYNVGGRTTRGFRGYAAGVDSKADVIMYFFK